MVSLNCQMEEEEIKKYVALCYKVYNEYNWLVNSYVLDFFTHDHWNKLPNSWKDFFVGTEPGNLSNILNVNSDLKLTNLPPLSLLSLRKLLRNLSLPRKNFHIHCSNDVFLDNHVDVLSTRKNILLHEDLHKDSKILKLFWKHVKPKKQHEINIMAEITFQTALKSNCEYVVDVGSGLGHLSRMLSYGYGLKVCGIEMQKKLVEQAKVLDGKFEVTAAKYYKDFNKFKSTPIHHNASIDTSITAEELLMLVKDVFRTNENQFMFGIVGLHPCGDLGATLLKLYSNWPNCKFINIVGCCYMKLSTINEKPNFGYPLSDFCKLNNYNLPYNSREIACHAIETYIERLKIGHHWELKIHAYRACIEKLIVAKWPNMSHFPLCNVKYTENLEFFDYCLKALKKYGTTLDKEEIDAQETQDNLADWLKVVIYYTLRLKIAPLVETIILLDRILFIEETGGKFDIFAAFDPKISPRNHILTAIKTDF